MLGGDGGSLVICESNGGGRGYGRLCAYVVMCLKDTKSMLSITSPDGKRCVNRGIKRNHFCYYNANYISSKLSHITMALKSPKIGKTKVAAGQQKLLNLSIALIQAQ